MIKDDRYVLEESTQTILAGQVLAYVTCCCWIYVGTLADELKSLAGAMMSSWRKSGKAAWNSMSIRIGSWLLWNIMGTMGIYDVGMIFAVWNWIGYTGLNILSRTEVGIKVMRAGEDNTISKTGW